MPIDKILQNFNMNINRSMPIDKILQNFNMNINRSMPIDKILQGGCGFHILVRNSDYVTSCPVLNYFNGTYIGQCVLYTGKCALLEIQLNYENFGAYYFFPPKPLAKTIFKKTICADYQLPKVLSKRSCNNLTFPVRHGHWEKENNIWHWIHGKCKYVIDSHDL